VLEIESMTDIAGGKRALLAFEQWPRRHASVLVAVASLALIAFYLSAWTNMPIYPDEIAIRLQSFRAIPDHGVRYSLFPYCSESASTSLPMLPIAYLLSAFDLIAGWSFVRVIPLLSILALAAAATLTMQKRAGVPAALLIPIAFVGVAGSGLILMRPECFLALQGATVFIGYRLIRTKRNSALDASWIVSSTIFGLISIHTHQQGLVLVPLSLIITAWLVVRSPSRGVKALGIFAAIWMVAGSYATLTTFSLACNEHPGIQGAVQDLTIFGPTAWPQFSSSLFPWIEKLQNYAGNFSFKESYVGGYLPAFSHDHFLSLDWLNTSILAAVFLNLALAAACIGGASVKSACILFRRGDTIGTRLTSFFGAGSTFLAFGGIAMLALLVTDRYPQFYRSHSIHLAFVLINVVALSALHIRRHALLAPVYCFAIALCLQSAVTTFKHIDSKFMAGWQGPSLSLKTDWNAVSASIFRLAKVCGIAKSQERIAIDDLTFTALREYPHLLAITYIGWAQTFVEPGIPLIHPVRKLATALLARCELNFGPNIPAGVTREGDICCANFE
jgi:hypothetical protein